MSQSSASTDIYREQPAPPPWDPPSENTTSSSDVEPEDELPSWVVQTDEEIAERRPGLNADRNRCWQAKIIANPISDWAKQEWSYETIRPGPRLYHRIHAEGWAAREIERHWPSWHFRVEVKWSWTWDKHLFGPVRSSVILLIDWHLHCSWQLMKPECFWNLCY